MSGRLLCGPGLGRRRNRGFLGGFAAAFWWGGGDEMSDGDWEGEGKGREVK